MKGHLTKIKKRKRAKHLLPKVFRPLEEQRKSKFLLKQPTVIDRKVEQSQIDTHLLVVQHLLGQPVPSDHEEVTVRNANCDFLP